MNTKLANRIHTVLRNMTEQDDFPEGFIKEVGQGLNELSVEEIAALFSQLIQDFGRHLHEDVVRHYDGDAQKWFAEAPDKQYKLLPLERLNALLTELPEFKSVLEKLRASVKRP